MKQDILDYLPQSHPWSELIRFYEMLPSTNTLAKELARDGAPSGTVIIAGQQTAGRGRLGRSFHSPKDQGLYLSLILRPDCPPEQLMHLTCAVGVAACDAVEAVTGIRPGIKWINDLTLGQKKLGGILTELGMGPGGLVEYAVIGIGINCRSQALPRELQGLACSLSDFGSEPEVPRLAAELILSLETVSRQLLNDQSGIMDRYRRDCVTVGSEVRVISPTGTETGLAEWVNDDGSLRVLFADGQRRCVNSGEVSVRGLWNYL